MSAPITIKKKHGCAMTPNIVGCAEWRRKSEKDRALLENLALTVVEMAEALLEANTAANRRALFRAVCDYRNKGE